MVKKNKVRFRKVPREFIIESFGIDAIDYADAWMDENFERTVARVRYAVGSIPGYGHRAFILHPDTDNPIAFYDEDDGYQPVPEGVLFVTT